MERNGRPATEHVRKCLRENAGDWGAGDCGGRLWGAGHCGETVGGLLGAEDGNCGGCRG